MKKQFKFLLLSLLMLINLSVFSQGYTPLVVDGSHWVISQCDGGALPPMGFAWEYLISGDTLVSSMRYKKVYVRPWNLGQSISSYELYRLIREDTLAKKVYSLGNDPLSFPTFGQCYSNNDTLLYDFDLEIGDTIMICVISKTIISEIVIQGNQWLSSRVYKLESGVELYEGVGSSFGLFEITEPSVSGGGDALLNHYCRGGDSCEFILSVGENQHSLINLNVYPNPGNNQLIIENGVNNFEDLILEIFSMHGKKELIKAVSSNEIKLDVSDFPQGIYFLQLKSEGEVIARQKWMKLE